jgi:CcmD family protein
MNPVLREIYSLIWPSAPYIIAAYALIWVSLFVYVLLISNRLKGLERELGVVESSLKRRGTEPAQSE